jgi:hypothetical protein
VKAYASLDRQRYAPEVNGKKPGARFESSRPGGQVFQTAASPTVISSVTWLSDQDEVVES